tara:strand:- start:1695 stop:2426 length:732 start_codon:yes stop_codon:yes gene_type:complete
MESTPESSPAGTPESVALLEADPAAFLRFESHRHAAAALKNIGYVHADTAPSFTSKQLAAAMQAVLSPEQITVLDLTPTLPETAHAAYQALTVSAFNAAASSRKDEKAVFLIMRTLENTPSFLFGHHWGNVQAFGKENATAPTTTPAVFLFYKQRQIEIPSEVCALDYELAARLIAAQVAEDHKYFCCGICGSALAESTKSGLHLREMAVTPTKVTFLKSCILTRVKAGQFDCPITGAPLYAP